MIDNFTNIRNSTILSCVIVLMLACGTPNNDDVATTPTPSSHSGQQARAFVETFMKASSATQKQLSTSLRPNAAEIQAVFVDTAIQRLVNIHLKEYFEDRQFTIAPRSEYNEVFIWTATSEELRIGNGQALFFPTDFLRMSPYLNDGLTFHRFKFVKKGNAAGMSFEGLININGRWVIFPKVWEAIERFQ